MSKQSIVCIAAHGNTLEKMKRYCFNSSFEASQDKFDLCIVFNGADRETLEYAKRFEPEYLYVKENFGLDQSAFDFAINRAGEYAYYILLHYDHWFEDRAWFDVLSKTMRDTGADVIGNLVRPAFLNLPASFYMVAASFGLENLVPDRFEHFLQGGAGLYNSRAIQVLKNRGGIPYGRSNSREIAATCERLQSFIMLDEGCTFLQIAPGYERYLKHAEHWRTDGLHNGR